MSANTGVARFCPEPVLACVVACLLAVPALSANAGIADVTNTYKISNWTSGGVPALTSDDKFGDACAHIGDVNLDGIEDVAVGARSFGSAGAVFVLLLSTNGTAKTHTMIHGTSGNGPALDANDAFGGGIAGIGDFDGDGVQDMLAGAFYDDDGSADAGAIYLLFMKTDGTVKSCQKISQTSGNGPALDPGGRFGIAAAMIGDMDDDGVRDLAVGAYCDDDGAATAGAVYILFMNADGTVKASQKISALAGGGPALDAADYFGVAVAGLGDLDGDTVEDIAVGACGDDDGAGGAGAIYVLFMNSDGTVKSSQKISRTAGNGPILAANSSFGRSVSATNDFDGDGIADLLVGANSDADGAANAGAVYILCLNSNGTVKSSDKISKTSGNGPSDLAASSFFGNGSTWISDLDGDDIPDMIVGAYGDSVGIGGAVYALLMNSDGAAKAYAKTSQTSGLGPRFAANDKAGYSVADLGDYDGDGIRDVIVGAYDDDDGAASAGAVYILSMRTDGSVKSQQKISSAAGNGPVLEAGDSFGVSVAGIGDIDNDGVRDALVGAHGDDDGLSAAGAVYVVFLTTNGTAKAVQKINSTSGGGPVLDASDYFGISAAALGDIDGDGVDDAAVGAHNDDDGGSDAGAIYVLFLNSDGTVKAFQKISDTSGNGPDLAGGCYFGMASGGTGDIDGDGVNDMIVGARGADAGLGAAFVLMLNTNGTVKTSQKIGNASGNGPPLEAGDCFGWGVGGTGDLDEDGIADAAVGARYDDDGASAAGAVYVLFLNTAGTVREWSKISATAGNGPTELMADDYFGGSVCGIGNLNGDRGMDLAAGAAGRDDDLVDSGAVYILMLEGPPPPKGTVFSVY